MSKSIKAKVGTYQKDGATKNRYQDIGAILSNQNGEYILLNPSVSLAGILAQQNAMSGESRGNVMCSIFDNDRQNQNSQPAASQGASPQSSGGGASGRFDGDTPFAPIGKYE